MILLLSNSLDVTTDILLPYLTERSDVFRFNIDLWRDYTWCLHGTGYELADPTGRHCCEAEIGAVYERKVMFNPPYIDVPALGSGESWLRAEVFNIWASIKDLAMGSGKLALIHPSSTGNWYKARQMRMASRYFPVLPWQMLHACPPELGPDIVCKVNTGAPTGTGACFCVSKVNPDHLDLSYPWFLQVCGDSAEEVTVAYIAGKMFASSLSRENMSTMDSRRTTAEGRANWEPCELTPDEQNKIRALMQETGFSFSRLDFLRTDKGLTFLELNPNGQFGWIDIQNKRGMLTAIADEVMRVHHRHPAPLRQ